MTSVSCVWLYTRPSTKTRCSLGLLTPAALPREIRIVPRPPRATGAHRLEVLQDVADLRLDHELERE
eukprot:2019993-Heterocapsa_arctica.AAC.1